MNEHGVAGLIFSTVLIVVLGVIAYFAKDILEWGAWFIR